MVLATPPKVQEILVRMQSAMKSNSEWFKAYISKSEKGKPLEFHKNFGITKQEYQHFLSQSKKMQLVKNGEATLNFSLNNQNEVEINGLPGKYPHDKLSYNVKSNIINIAKNSLGEFTTINQTKSDSPTGKWTGVQWKIQEVNSASDYKSIKFAIGTLSEENKNIIYYDVNIAVDGTPNKLSYILLYDPA